MLTSNGFLLFCEAWWAGQVKSVYHSDLLQTLLLHCQLRLQQTGVKVCHSTLGRKWFLLGEEGRSDIGEGVWKFWNCLHFLLTSAVHALQLCLLWLDAGKENRDAGSMERNGRCHCTVGLWSILSMVDVVNSPIGRTGRQTTTSSTYLLTVVSPICVDISSTLSYEMLMPCS